jgi:secondary thiamine-phosphate synthase enzyme
MRVYQKVLSVRTGGRGPIDITEDVATIVAQSSIETGLCTVFIQHTSAGLIIQENADPAVLRDLSRWLSEVAPESDAWEHDDEGKDDMPAHLRSLLTRTSESIPVSHGRLALGTWQGLYVWEHRTSPHTRHVVIHVTGESKG